MATLSLTHGTSTALTVTGLGTLAAANYATSAAVSCTTRTVTDFEIEVEYAVGSAPSGNKQLVVFVITSDDGTNYTTQNSSATDTTHDANMKWVATIPITAAETIRDKFLIGPALNYVMPPDSFKLVFKNDAGVALTSATVNTRTITTSVA